VPQSQTQLLQQIDSYFNQSQRDYAKGDYAAGGTALGKAQALISRYLTKYGNLPSGGPSGGG
jgi:hypothetical protein